MANLTDTPVYETGVFQLETATQVLGGVGGPSNTQAQQLANRTAYLKTQTDELNALRGIDMPAFSTGVAYSAGQTVSYLNNFWRANTSIPAGAWNATNWTKLLSDASTTLPGLVEKATSGETNSGEADKYPDAALIKSARTMYPLYGAVLVDGLITLNGGYSWDDFEQIVIEYGDNASGPPIAGHHLLFTEILTPSDSTTVFENRINSQDGTVSFNFQNSDRTKMYVIDSGDDDRINAIYGRYRKT